MGGSWVYSSGACLVSSGPDAPLLNGIPGSAYDSMALHCRNKILSILATSVVSGNPSDVRFVAVNDMWLNHGFPSELKGIDPCDLDSELWQETLEFHESREDLSRSPPRHQEF